MSSRILIGLLFYAALVWLMVGGMLSVLAAVQLGWPQIFPHFGVCAPAAANVLVYGWISNAAFAVAVWLLSPDREPFRVSALPVVSAFVWQLGVGLGFLGLLFGQGRGVFLLDFPAFAMWPLLFGGLGLVGWLLTLFLTLRSESPLYASIWYIVAALLAFPWLLSTGFLSLFFSGLGQAVAAAWFSGGIVNLWLAPAALACLYFLIPAILDRRLASYHFARLGFWAFVALGAWSGLTQLIGGPVPAWVSATGAFAGQLSILPVIVISLNLLASVIGVAHPDSTALRFAVVGAVAFLVAYSIGTLLALPGLSGVFRFTDVNLALGVLLVGGFATSAFVGMIIHLCDVPQTRLIFWLMTVSWVFAFLCLALGGIIQGFAQADPAVNFAASVTYIMPFRILAAVGLCGFLVSTFLFFARAGIRLFRA